MLNESKLRKLRAISFADLCSGISIILAFPESLCHSSSEEWSAQVDEDEAIIPRISDLACEQLHRRYTCIYCLCLFLPLHVRSGLLLVSVVQAAHLYLALTFLSLDVVFSPNTLAILSAPTPFTEWASGSLRIEVRAQDLSMRLRPRNRAVKLSDGVPPPLRLLSRC